MDARAPHFCATRAQNRLNDTGSTQVAHWPAFRATSLAIVVLVSSRAANSRVTGSRLSGASLEHRRLRRLLFEFGVIGGLEVYPTRRVAVEAAAKRIARRDFLQPQVDLRPLPRQTAGPQAIHQDADAVFRVRRPIDAFDPQPLLGHFTLETTIMVEVPCARMRPSRAVTRASVEMIWRVCDTTWASALRPGIGGDRSRQILVSTV